MNDTLTYTLSIRPFESDGSDGLTPGWYIETETTLEGQPDKERRRYGPMSVELVGYMKQELKVQHDRMIKHIEQHLGYWREHSS